MSLDPLMAKYPNMSPYIFVNNMPILAIDLKGEEIEIYWISTNSSDPTEWFGHVALNLVGTNVTKTDDKDMQGATGARYFPAPTRPRLQRGRF